MLEQPRVHCTYNRQNICKCNNFHFSETEVICEGQESTISCAHTPGTVLNIVFANYGRRGDDLCLHTHMRNKYCLTTNSTAIVKNRCESKVSCLLQANNVAFGGDPCGGTYKYLELRFQCKVSGLYQ